MRLLYLCRGDDYSGKNALVNNPQTMITYMLQHDPNLFVYWTVPNTASIEDIAGFLARFNRDGIEVADRVKTVPVSMMSQSRLNGYIMSGEIIDNLAQSKTELQYDAVCSEMLGLSGVYWTLMANKYGNRNYHVNVPFINMGLWMLTEAQDKAVPEYSMGEIDFFTESMATHWGKNLIESQFIYDQHFKTINRYYRPAILQKIKENTEICTPGINISWIEPIREELLEKRKSRENPNMFWGGRLANQKSPPDTFEIMENSRKMIGGECIVSTPSPESKAKPYIEKYPDWTFKSKQNVHEFYNSMTEGDIFVCINKFDTYGIAWWEMLYSGQIGVFVDNAFSKSFLPDWYPFRGNQKEVAEWVQVLKKDFPDGKLWKEYLPRIKEWLEEEHDSKKNSVKTLAHIQRWHDESVNNTKSGPLTDLAKAAADSLWDGSPIPEQMIWAKMQELSESGREFGRKGDMMTRMFLRRCIIKAGYKDLCLDEKVLYVRGD